MSRHSPVLTLILAVCAIGLVVTLVSHPETSYRAAVSGLKIWWDVVFPALLPFIVVSEILMGLGVVHFVGVLLEPVMRPFFNVPGTGGFVLTMGFSSGYPVAAKLTTRLREQGNLTRVEGERLVSFTTTADPLFVIGAVSVGFFHSEQLGVVLTASHYLSAIILGFCFRFFAGHTPITRPLEKQQRSLAYRSLQAMHRARLRDKRPFGQLMGDAVFSALQMQLMIGGFLVVFSVLMEMFEVINITRFLSAILMVVLGPLGLPEGFSQALVTGLFEVTLGAQAVSDVPANVSFMWKAAITSSVLAWGGLSVHAQVASILSSTDIRVTPYLMARCIHAVLAAVMTLALWRPLMTLTAGWVSSVPVFLPNTFPSTADVWRDVFFRSSATALAILLILIALSAIIRKFAVKRPRYR
ncbi:sporulation integral membrane protein YlbJ [Brevibacillus massiliensis]|jgi:sporulation integral membrane protein YlbJ|uniref:sporulation integral membrane protein YlbJ n=1 Tax=Brevibacillus massiliensis TaxID=1118054 RepID=UPI0002EC9769|nr:sporulation integral membrane protein YlbJ [Brevibacillus massiliensis]